MAININNLSNTSQVKQKVEQQVSESTNTSQQAKLTPRDSVSISPQATQMSELQKKAADSPVLNQKKIAELKSAIASGDYKINPEKLAASIANFEFDLG
ncbi:MAG: negative regulator of flagellin synthesis FlgM [Psychroserpens sp.]|jgi:negative regulator of flagellin synthesis FlgM